MPNRNKVIQELLPKLEFIVTVDALMNTSARYADIVLPGCTFFEYPDVVASLDNPYLQLQQPAIAPRFESKSDFDIITELAHKMGFGRYFDLNPEQAIEQMLTGHPSVEDITLEKLKQGPIPLPHYEMPEFLTPSGRLEFYLEGLKPFDQELPVYIPPLETENPELKDKYPLCYLTTHSKYSMNSTFAKVAWLRELDPEPFVEMNPVDAGERHIHDGDRVIVFNDRGMVNVKAKVHEGIRPGVVNLSQGWWPDQHIQGDFQSLTHGTINSVQKSILEPNAPFFDVMVEVRREGGID
jgi:molybdopterin-containing oxidoreductase family molybdopterin binding subunit